LAPLPLAHRREGQGPPVLCLHGLLGSGRNWAGVASALAPGSDVVLPDLRNHGASPWSDEVGYPAMADDVASLLDSLGLASARLVGHSMGGKVAMTLALTRPERVERLVVVDIAPVAYRHGFEDFITAMLAVDLDRVTRRADADAALAPAIPEPRVRAFLLQNLEQRDGRFAWRPNLRALLAGMATITGVPALPDARPYRGPCCFIRGATSDYVRDEHLPRIRALFPNAELRTIEGAGHWLHAERPREFLDALGGCLGG